MDPQMQTGAGGQSTPLTFLAIVRRGDEELFGTLQRQFKGEAEVRVIWDRRLAERRVREAPVSGDRRGGDRRGLAPTSWDLGVVFVSEGSGTPETGSSART